MALLTLASAAVGSAGAQSGKKPITQDVYDLWRSISGAALSTDGKWAMYTVSPAVGEGELVIRSTSGSTEYKFPRGYTGRPQLQAGADSAALFSAAPAQFSGNGQYAAYVKYPSAQAVEASRKAPRNRPVPMPRNDMGVVRLSDGNVMLIARVRSFKMARDGGKYIAYLMESDTAAAQSGGGA
ncbi:MAG: hypothetical protein EBS65_22790, partial [Betaproteobacteria bacterium]|nr:hypothetical protein [Betaproteobacteria bacterium]